ncbi:hypothetical protein [Streptomyces sp. MS191]|uniref:hypothetical protein n=1 Tax=Streptomyces sp. ms191 TaxID=1827978 RepID=UPI0011CDD176|nr:hypothetical protein [Streptomyces sp. ms191]
MVSASARSKISIFGSLAMIFGVSGCATLEDPGGRFPEGKVVDSRTLQQEWKNPDSLLKLKGNGEFEAENLKARYFECGDGGGEHSKGGQGKWQEGEDGDSSEVFLKFADGCSATFWLGEIDDVLVLWTEFEVDGDLIMLRN